MFHIASGLPAIPSMMRLLLNGSSETESISCRPTSGEFTVSSLLLEVCHLLLHNYHSHLHWSTIPSETPSGGGLQTPHSERYYNAGR